MAIDRKAISLSNLYSKARELFTPVSTAVKMAVNPAGFAANRLGQAIANPPGGFSAGVQRVKTAFKNDPVSFSLPGMMAANRIPVVNKIPFTSTFGKAYEGFLEGSTANLIDVPAPKSTNFGQSLAYGVGNIGGMINPYSALGKVGKVVKAAPIVTQAQKPLLKLATKVATKSNIAGKAIKGLTEGLPYTIGYAGLKQAVSPITGQGYTKEDLGTDLGVDLAMGAAGALPIFAGLSKIAKDKRIRTVIQNEFNVRDALWSVQNYNKLSPQVQISTWQKVDDVAKKIIPDVVNSREMKTLSRTNPTEWLRTTTRFLEDALVQAKNPSMDIGLSTKALGGKPPTDVIPTRSGSQKLANPIQELAKQQVGIEPTSQAKTAADSLSAFPAQQIGSQTQLQQKIGRATKPESRLALDKIIAEGNKQKGLVNLKQQLNQATQPSNGKAKLGKVTTEPELPKEAQISPQVKTSDYQSLKGDPNFSDGGIPPQLQPKVKIPQQTQKVSLSVPPASKKLETATQKLEVVRQAKQQSVKTNQVDLPSVEDTIRSSNLDVKNKVNLLDYFRTPDRVLQKIGLGKQSEAIKSSYNNYLDELPKEIDRITNWYKQVGSSQESSQRIFKYLDGQDQKLAPNEQKVANEIKEYLSVWADRLGLPDDKRIASYITHIFENDFIQKEFDPELAKLIQDKVPGSVYDPFLQQRLGKLGYVEDVFRALDAYVKRATRKANMDPALEQLQAAAEKLDIDSWNYVKKYADRVNLRPTDTDNLFDNLIKSSPIGYKLGQRPVARVSRGVRQSVYRGTLGFNFGSAIRNLTQGVNTYAQLGEKYTGIGYMKALKSIATKSDELERVGVLRNSFIEDRGLSATKKFWENLDKGLFYFFEMAEKINRGSAYFGAKSKALAEGLSEEQAIKAGIDMARKTQFTFGSVDTPVNLQSDLVKLLTQFQSFNVKQTEFLSEMVKSKQYAGMVRWLGANAVILFTVGQAMGWDWKDMIPFGGIADGQSPIGSSPAITLIKDIGKVAIGGTDRYGNPIKPTQILKDVIPIIPGGVQMNKTIGGLKDTIRGYDESAAGRVKFPIAQTPRNYIQSAILGSSNLPEARAYKRLETTPLGEKQSPAFKEILRTQGPEQARSFYDSILNKRGKSEVVDAQGESSTDINVIEAKLSNAPNLLTPDEIATYYESRVTKPTDSEYSKAVYESNIWDQISNINQRDSLTQEQKDAASLSLLERISVSPQEYQYYTVAKQTNDLKSMYVEEELTKMMASGASRDQIWAWLEDSRKEVNGKQLLTSGVIDDLVDKNIISYSQGKQLKNTTIKGKGTSKVKKLKVKMPKLKKIAIKSIKYPKVKIVKSASSKFKAPKIKRIKIKKPRKAKSS